MRSTILSLVTFFILCGSNRPSSAQTWIDVSVQSVLEDGIHLNVILRSNNWYTDTDCLVRNSCQSTLVTLETPIGTFTYPPGFQNTPEFVVPYGETWEFTGYFERSWGWPVDENCYVDCVKRRDATPYTFDAVSRMDAGHWEITPLSETPDTLYATAKIVSNYWHYDARFGKCPDFYYSMIVRPCVAGVWLGQQWIPSFQCSNGESIWVSHQNSNDREFVIAFPRGPEYQIEGRVSINYLNNSCEWDVYSFIIALGPVTFSTKSVATRQATWGQIKALYRAP